MESRIVHQQKPAVFQHTDRRGGKKAHSLVDSPCRGSCCCCCCIHLLLKCVHNKTWGMKFIAETYAINAKPPWMLLSLCSRFGAHFSEKKLVHRFFNVRVESFRLHKLKLPIKTPARLAPDFRFSIFRVSWLREPRPRTRCEPDRKTTNSFPAARRQP